MLLSAITLAAAEITPAEERDIAQGLSGAVASG
jgi:hypothetical protein